MIEERGRPRGGRPRSPAGDYLRSLRVSRNLTQQEIQKRGALGAQYISKIETGTIFVSSDNIERIVTAYQLDLPQREEVLRLSAEALQLNTVSPATCAPHSNITHAECNVLYGLLALPKESAERVIQVYNAYNKVSEETA